MTYAIYAEVPNYNDYDAIESVSLVFTGRRYFSKELACKIAGRLSDYDDSYRVVCDGDRWFQPVHSERPVNLDDCPF